MSRLGSHAAPLNAALALALACAAMLVFASTSPAQSLTLPVDQEEWVTWQQPRADRLPVFGGTFGAAAGTGVAVGGERTYVNERGAVAAFDSETLTRLWEHRVYPYETGWGLTYYRGNVYSIIWNHRDHLSGLSQGQYIAELDAKTGVRKRLIPIELGIPLDRERDLLGEITGVTAAWNELWIRFRGTEVGAPIIVLDIATGAVKSVSWHTARHGCVMSLPRLQADADWCIRELEEYLTTSSVGTGWDISAVPELGGVMVDCRFIDRVGLVAPVALGQVYVSDAQTPPSCGIPRVDGSSRIGGTDAVWGMKWYLVTAAGEDTWGGGQRTIQESRLSERGATPVTTEGMVDPAPARRWNPSTPPISDVAYHMREVRIHWGGVLKEDKWLRGRRCTDYIVSDADIYLTARDPFARQQRHERWYELARNFKSIELAVDGKVFASSLTPTGQLCVDTELADAKLNSGQHRLTLTAYIGDANETRQVVAANDTFRIDKTPPAGSLSPVARWVRGTVALQGTVTDAHAGPRDGRIEAAKVGGATTTVCPAAASPYGCNWVTNGYGDGDYVVTGRLRDLLTQPLGGPNAGSTPGLTVGVDNTAPTISLSDVLWDARDFRPLIPINEYPVMIGIGDATSGAAGAELLVDGVAQPLAAASCGSQLCRSFTFRPGSFTEGTHTIEVRAVDRAGNPANPVRWDVDVEAQPPDTPETSARMMPALTASELAALPTPEEVLPCTADGAQPNFPVWSLGPAFEGMSRVASVRRCDEPSPVEPIRRNTVTHVYGGCTEPVDEGTCSAPLEIQSWPACERNLASYDIGPVEFRPQRVDLQLRGVPAAKFEDGRRVELYTGVSTVVIFGGDPALVLRAAQAVRQEALGAGPLIDLPAPAPGATTGDLTCAIQLGLNEVERKENDVLGIL